MNSQRLSTYRKITEDDRLEDGMLSEDLTTENESGNEPVRKPVT